VTGVLLGHVYRVLGAAEIARVGPLSSLAEPVGELLPARDGEPTRVVTR